MLEWPFLWIIIQSFSNIFASLTNEKVLKSEKREKGKYLPIDLSNKFLATSVKH